ncbi:MAG: glycerophosphodiester phosphodiesterase [Zoogloea sp.]|uniref:glycerophosphodiester phosphodiesterase n=1 Tax=Zoogloea sp. TaxID=49181 RepID=UPI002608057E|nr:glycerophosphodiester phosphodiesterase [Zoogloea sp.]MDD3329276.1 glycerophosphodiester phosphodiesterase [Zoogloea sp.]
MPHWPWPDVIAHRCGGALAPENTLAGLAVAARLGCAAVEFDVMLSQDGVPVLIHDETLDRCAMSSGHVAGISAERLMATDVGARFHPAFAGETIPSLEAALQHCRRLGLAANLEIKPAAGFEVETGRVVGRLLGSLGRDERPALLLSSFSDRALEAAAREAAELPRGWLTGAFDADALNTALRLGCASLHLALDGLDVAQVAAARAAGLRVLVYTVNSLADARRLIGWCASGVFTDRPDRLLDAIH